MRSGLTALISLAAFAVPLPAQAASGDYCASSTWIRSFDTTSKARHTVPAGRPGFYELRILGGEWNRVEIHVRATDTVNGAQRTYPVTSTVLRHNHGDTFRVIVRPRRTTTYSWTGAVFCGPDTIHADLAPNLAPATIRVVGGAAR